MALYPENAPMLKDFTTEFNNSTRIVDFVWGKKIYGYINGKLSALKPIALILENKGYENYMTLWANVAGVGETTYSPYAHFFRSVEDFNKYLDGDKSVELKFSECPLRNMVSHHYKIEYAHLGASHIKGYTPSIYSVTPTDTTMYFRKLWYDADGLHIEFSNPKQFIKYEDALKAQHKLIEVVDFDDEEETITKEFNLSINISVKATSRESAEENIRKVLSEVGLNV